ncbi:hypothetical protein FOA52_001960 [Chlamydomonas sp. UWO 241]|nr:hypothetical protein FOA52_001960 [Chlamydomonas sp. UWO 241]
MNNDKPVGGEKDGSAWLPPVDGTTTDATLFSNALFDALNDCRANNGLPKVPHSLTMTHVAQAHVADLFDPDRELPYSAACNPHSWTTGPNMCCYDSYHTNPGCMWDKPSQLTGGRYPGAGFEVLMSASGSLDAVEIARRAVTGWAESAPHRTVILNEAPWSDIFFQALGCSEKHM